MRQSVSEGVCQGVCQGACQGCAVHAAAKGVRCMRQPSVCGVCDWRRREFREAAAHCHIGEVHGRIRAAHRQQRPPRSERCASRPSLTMVPPWAAPETMVVRPMERSPSKPTT
eukprot:358735-Prymnesium_polylepis.1